jgi:hypothetical protein
MEPLIWLQIVIELDETSGCHTGEHEDEGILRRVVSKKMIDVAEVTTSTKLRGAISQKAVHIHIFCLQLS